MRVMRALLYRLYEYRLAREIRGGPTPQHVGVILDGNRRYARERGLPDAAGGHQAGAERVVPFLTWCEQRQIPYVTLWLLSTDNLHRDDAELLPLMRIIEDTVSRIVSAGRPWRLTVVGALEMLPEDTRACLRQAEHDSSTNPGMRVQVAVGYGGREEITTALRRLLAARAADGVTLEELAETLEPHDIGAHLYTTGLPDPDLIIRTSGEVRLSGFLLWQSAYSEYYFCDTFWPAFRHIDFLRALREYQRRSRRFGR
jgi:short-chain Z-isoprenyl diphosphate synthase